MKEGGDPRLGGGGHWFSTDAAPGSLQHGLDVALAQAVWRILRPVATAQFASGQKTSGAARAASFGRRLARDLAKSPWHTLTPKMRTALERCLSLKQVEAVYANARASAGIGGSEPECLRRENLPKKPPAKKRDPDE